MLALGTSVPAIGATPYLLRGGLYPIAALPEGVCQFVWILSRRHAAAPLRHGFTGSQAAKLDQVWHLHSETLMVVLSLTVLAAFAVDDHDRDAGRPPRLPRTNRKG
jgi:hypothetical protein